MEEANRNQDSNRRRFIRRLTTLGAAGGIAALLSGRVTEKPFIQPAQAADVYLTVDQTKIGTGITRLDSSVTGTDAAFEVTATAYSGSPRGIFGKSGADNGIGVYGVAQTYASSVGNSPTGVYGEAWGTGGSPDIGDGPWPTGVAGYASALSGETRGVEGVVDSTGGFGVRGMANASTGWAVGVWGGTNSVTGTGVRGRSNPDGGPWETGPYPTAINAYADGEGATTGVYGEVRSNIGIGVYGYADAASGQACGVEGDTPSQEGGVGVVGWAYATSGYNAGVYGASRAPEGAGVQGDARASGCIGIVGTAASGFPDAYPILAWGTSGQTASLQEWGRRDLGTLSVVDASGQLGVGTSAPVAPLHLYYNTPTMLKAEADGSTPCILSLDTYAAGSTTSGAGFVGRHSRGTKASPSDVVVSDRLGFNIFGGYAGGAFRHVAGIEGVVDTGTVSGSSLPSAIRFLTTPDGSMSRQERMRIDANGNIIPPTDNSGSIGTASKRWSNLYVVTLHQGDIQFENNFCVTEDETAGLAFKNDSGERIAVLDREGNWHIKGKVMEDL